MFLGLCCLRYWVDRLYVQIRSLIIICITLVLFRSLSSCTHFFFSSVFNLYTHTYMNLLLILSFYISKAFWAFWALEWGWRRLRSLLLGDLQQPPGWGTGQPALGVSAGAGVRPDGPRAAFQPQPFFYSVILSIQNHCRWLNVFTDGLSHTHWVNIRLGRGLWWAILLPLQYFFSLSTSWPLPFSYSLIQIGRVTLAKCFDICPLSPQQFLCTQPSLICILQVVSSELEAL